MAPFGSRRRLVDYFFVAFFAVIAVTFSAIVFLPPPQHAIAVLLWWVNPGGTDPRILPHHVGHSPRAHEESRHTASTSSGHSDAPRHAARYLTAAGAEISSTSIVIATSSLTTTPPPSSARLQVRPKSCRLSFAGGRRAGAGRAALVLDGRPERPRRRAPRPSSRRASSGRRSP